MKKILTILFILFGILEANELYKFQTIKPALYNSNSKYIDMEYLLKYRKKINNIINELEILQKDMKGFQERKIITELLNEFKMKYYINDTDIIKIKQGLNRYINIKKQEEKYKTKDKIKLFKVK